MEFIAYTDDIYKLCNANIKRDYSQIREEIINNKENLTYYYQKGESVWGYKIAQNQPLTDLYKLNVKVVRFYLSDIQTLHSDEQEQIMNHLISHLKEDMNREKGYYNLRVPAHIVDMIKAINSNISNSIFCGGTVEQYIHGKKIAIDMKDGIKTFFADTNYIQKYKTELLKMTYTSFESYQGQYHISAVTSEKAGQIYENWIHSFFDKLDNYKVLVVEYNEKPIGFCTIGETEYAVEGILSAVSNEHRKLGAYRTMISTLINYAYDNGKSFTASTQFDNYIVQGTWNSMGMKPYFSFYNFHFSNI